MMQGLICIAFPNDVVITKSCMDALAIQTNPDGMEELKAEAEAAMGMTMEEAMAEAEAGAGAVGEYAQHALQHFKAIGIAPSQSCEGKTEADLMERFNPMKFCGTVVSLY